MELRDDTIWDGETAVAAVVPAVDGAVVSLQLLAPVVMTDPLAVEIVGALTGTGTNLPAVAVGDELVRNAARAAGWTGALRAPLSAPLSAPTGSAPAAEPADVATAVAALLPGTVVERRGFGRKVLSLRATGPDGLRLKVKVPDRPDVIPELLAGALDVAFGVRRRFGRMASGVHSIAVDDGAGTFDDHRTLGSAQSGTGTFFLDTSLAFVGAMDQQRRRMSGRGGVSATPSRPWFAIDGVVAHEYWHNLDTTVVATPAVYLELNRALGEELGVETYEHALRGREPGAPPAWQAGFQRILHEVSPYATTNWRESTAELFKLWWCRPPAGPPSPLVTAFGALLDRFYPPPA